MHFCIEIYDSEVTGKVRYRAKVYNRYIPMGQTGDGTSEEAAKADVYRALKAEQTTLIREVATVTDAVEYCEAALRELHPPAKTDEAEGGDGE